MKPSYRSTSVKNYLECPRKFFLYHKHEIERSKEMKAGNLFESLVFGFKEQIIKEYNLLDDVDCDSVPLSEFGITAKTYESYKKSAVYAQKVFVGGEPFKKYSVETDNWILTGEADYVGDIQFNGATLRCIADLKFSGDIQKLWRDKSDSVSEYLQSVFYCYLHYKDTQELLPFVYVVVERDGNLQDNISPYITQVIVRPTFKDFQKLEILLDKITDDFEMAPNLNACVTGPYWNYECQYMQHCKFGRALKENPIEVMEINWGTYV